MQMINYQMVLDQLIQKREIIKSLFAPSPCYRGIDEWHTGCILPYGHYGEHLAIRLSMLCQCQGGWYPCITIHNEDYCPSASHDPGDEDGEQKFFFAFTRFP